MATSGSFVAYCVTSGVTDKYIKFEWTATQSIANNTSTISWKLLGGDPDGGYVKAGGFQVHIDGDVVHSNEEDYRVKMYTDTLLASGTKTLTHNDNGARDFEVYIAAGIYNYAINTEGTKTFTLDTIPRKSTLSVSDGTLGTAQTLTVTRKVTSFTHSIKAVCGSSTLYIKADGSTSSSEVKHTDCDISFTPPLSWSSQNTTGSSVSVKYTITTYNGSTSIGANSYTKKYSIPDSVIPVCTLSVSDAMGYAATFGAYIQGQSKFKLTAAFTAAYGSDILSRSITADGKTYTENVNETEVITNSGSLEINASVTDKRGRKGTDSATVKVAKYTKPNISHLSVRRCQADGTPDDMGGYVEVTYSFAIDDFSEAESALGITMSAENAHTAKIEYKKTSETSWITGTTVNEYSATKANYIFEAAEDSSYNVRIVVEDSFDSVDKSTPVSTADVIYHVRADGTGISFGKVSEHENSYEFAKEMYDRFDTKIANGFAECATDANNHIDPNITLSHVILTEHANAPLGGAAPFYVLTFFHQTKSVDAPRAQIAFPQDGAGTIYCRRYNDGVWSDWVGAVSKNGDTMTDILTIESSGNGAETHFINSNGIKASVGINESNNIGLYDHTNGKWILRYNPSDKKISILDVDPATIGAATAPGSWTNLTYNDGFATVNQALQYRIMDGFVQVRGHISTPELGTASIYITTDAVPSAARPSYTVHFYATCAGARVARCWMNPSGRLAIEWAYGLSDNARCTTALSWLSINLEYPI